MDTRFYKTIIHVMKNYYETKNYIFVHGWIPCMVIGRGSNIKDTFIKRIGENKIKLSGICSTAKRNGYIKLWRKKATKTIVCGHWLC